MNYLDSQPQLCLLYELKAIIASGWHRIKIFFSYPYAEISQASFPVINPIRCLAVLCSPLLFLINLYLPGSNQVRDVCVCHLVCVWRLAERLKHLT